MTANRMRSLGSSSPAIASSSGSSTIRFGVFMLAEYAGRLGHCLSV